MIKVNHIIWTLAVALTLTACAQDKLIITGESMTLMADEFVATAHAMDKALDAKTITPQEYKDWSTFGKKFQLVYPQAVAMWKIARWTKNDKLEAQMLELATELGMELATYKGGK